MKDEIKEIRRRAGLTEGDVVPFGRKEEPEDDEPGIEEQLNANLPNLGPDKKLMADFNEQHGTIEIWIETDEIITLTDMQTLQKNVNMVYEAHFIGIQPTSSYGVKMVFSTR